MARLEQNVYHIPVMAGTCLDYMQPQRGGVFVDATLGGGGHTRLLIEQLPAESIIVAFDADEFAIQRAAPLVQSAAERSIALHLIHANFSTLPEVLTGFPSVQAVLFDLGVSSFQFDYHPRGFSFRQDAPLDMRFSSEGNTAAEIINSSTEHELTALFREYGEDPAAKRLAAAIVRRRTIAPYKTTVDLRDTIIQHIPPQHQAKTLSRIFQALRIAVNEELRNLEVALSGALHAMSVGGRAVVMSYHSLEDRIVKDMFKQHSHQDGSHPTVSILTRKPQMALPEEVAENPRARSARLRVAEVVHL